jgi:uncharacterized membrane protein YfhO
MDKLLTNPDQINLVKEPDIDYSEMYRTQEMKQLNKRLRRTRNILYICAIAVVGGALVFWMMKDSSFTTKNFLLYLALSVVLAFLGFISEKRPYKALVIALVICIAFWAVEVILNKTDDLLIEGSIQKLFIISLLTSSLHASKEAELIRKELHFS